MEEVMRSGFKVPLLKSGNTKRTVPFLRGFLPRVCNVGPAG